MSGRCAFDHPGRPVKRPTENEARVALARDLSRGWLDIDMAKAGRLNCLPLFEVALDGRYGYLFALRQLRERMAA